ncbi:NAD(P)/FAD-dependent oxidoreductase [Chelativorans xinjiangense]|uniref:NAD(P)/FAD-dependent oxidoreductase n=1 Tax=Chelativorans xinjiangense TaxID=2681485 RepID=UPI00135B486C|nr:NAD(P)/FAD-dependent oxidoreductase [Chelativorans xinjiangense]
MKHRIVIVGAGFAGLTVVKVLKGCDCDITLIDQRNHHLFQPLLYQVATTLLATSDIAWPIRALLRERKDVTTLLGTVDGVDRDVCEVILCDGNRVPYDTLVIATGARHAYFGKDHWEVDAPGLKTLEDATTIRRRLLLAFERAEVTEDKTEREAQLTFAVIGAGPTGVELVGIIAELAHRVLPGEFRRIDTRRAKVLLVEAGPRILPAFGDRLSAYATHALARRGVEVKTGVPVTECSSDGIVLGGEFIPARTVIWAAGVQASRAKDWLGAKADRAGRVVVNADLTLPGDPSIFVLGDTAHVEDGGQLVPGVAPAAKQQGNHAARTIRARLKGRKPPGSFRYRNMGNLATIGRNAAVIEYGRFQMKGWLAWWVWGIAHIYFLIGARSRLFVSLSWLWIFLSGQNSARLITQKETLKDLNVSGERAAKDAEGPRV